MANIAPQKTKWVAVVSFLVFIVLLTAAPTIRSWLVEQGLIESTEVTESTTDNDSEAETDADPDQQPSGELGVLRETGDGELISTAGLRYTRGSREGHRLDHVLRHDDDLPDRDGRHGVFDGDQEDMLAVIDEAYLMIVRRDPQAEIEVDGDRLVCDVDMQRRIGFVGGETGQRDGHPAVQTVRLVLEGDRLITAYPVEP